MRIYLGKEKDKMMPQSGSFQAQYRFWDHQSHDQRHLQANRNESQKNKLTIAQPVTCLQDSALATLTCCGLVCWPRWVQEPCPTVWPPTKHNLTLSFREMQIKIKMRHHYTNLRIATKTTIKENTTFWQRFKEIGSSVLDEWGGKMASEAGVFFKHRPHAFRINLPILYRN